jgi:hypothetical protein
MHKAIQNFKMVSVTPPAAIVDNAAFTTAEVDTKGFDYALFKVYIGAIDIAMAALQVTESDTSGSGHAAIAGTVFGTAADIEGTTTALPSADDDNTFVVIGIDLRGRKRYLDLNMTAGNGAAGTFAAAWCELYTADAMPTTVAGHGCSAMVMV